MAGLRAGDQDVYETLVRAYSGRLLAVTRRLLRTEEDARDAVQDAFLSAFRGTGICTNILRDLLAEVDAVGKPVRIHVERENPALRLYQRLGLVMIEDKGVHLFMERRA